MRKLALPLAACAVLGVTATPAFAQSTNVKQNQKLGQINGALKGVQKAVGILQDINTGQTASINSAHAKVDQVLNVVVPAAVKALTDINAALTNSTTGLVGLNLARPQFAAFGDQGTLLASSGTSGGKGPTTNAIQFGAAPGIYVVNFQNDVSKRYLTAQPLPTAAGNDPGVGQVVSCASSTATAATCGLVQGAGSDDSPNKVLVKFGAGTSKPASGFTVSAISG